MLMRRLTLTAAPVLCAFAIALAPYSRADVTGQGDVSPQGPVDLPIDGGVVTGPVIVGGAGVDSSELGDLTIDLRDNTLTLAADIAPVDDTNEDKVLVEYETGRYYRQFTLGELINQENIDAKLNDGVLRLSLPKVEKATPKKITVNTG